MSTRNTTATGVNALIAQVLFEEGAVIKKGQCLAQWDPYSVPILAEQNGVIDFHDFVENVSVKKEVDEATGLKGTIVLETKEDLHQGCLACAVLP